MFDEYLNYPGWQQHEHKAFAEFIARTGRRYRYLGFASSQFAVSGTDSVSIEQAWQQLQATLAGRPVPPLVIVIGLGEGDLLGALERHAPATRVLALEPNPAAAHVFTSRRAWQGWLDRGRITYLTGPDYAGANEAWRAFPATRMTTSSSSIRRLLARAAPWPLMRRGH